MTTVNERCPICDRGDCPRITRTILEGNQLLPGSSYQHVWEIDKRDCESHAVDWRARYLEDQKRARVGIAVIVRKGSAVLIGQRRDEQKKSRGHGTWALPGGHLEYLESIEDCAIREVREETGLVIGDLRTGTYVNNIFGEDGRHYVTLFVHAEVMSYSDEPKVMEPDKCFEWRWCYRRAEPEKGWGTVPEPMFPPLKNYMDKYDLWQRPK
jgi:8-oxo-dGTP diphosphatase